jgi:hypothetical protein
VAGAEEIVLPFATERHLVEPATFVRSTLLMSSLRALREEKLVDRYRAALPAEHHDPIFGAVAPQWLPVALAVAHYDACDKLQLTPTELVQLGMRVAHFAQGTFIKTVVAFATSAGATPWTLLMQGRRMWERAWIGSDLAVFKLGPKEARLEIVGCPCARIPYFRTANRGILQSVVQLLAQRAYVSEIRKLSTETSLAYKMQWV